jgi:putative tryptophan/tyrosine transport system substrate-binding protein
MSSGCTAVRSIPCLAVGTRLGGGGRCFTPVGLRKINGLVTFAIHLLFGVRLMAITALKWRGYVALLCGAATWPMMMPAAAQDAKVPRVGVLTPAESDSTPAFKAFKQGLRDLGYVEGKSIFLDFRFAKGHADALPGLAAALVKIPVDVIVADSTTAARAAKDASRDVPIVQAVGGDPVRAGMASSLAHPGGNLTGFTIRTDELSGKRLELLKRAFPGIKCVSILLDPTNVITKPLLSATEKAAEALDIRLNILAASTPEELHALRPANLASCDGLLVLPGPMFWNHRTTIIAIAAAARVPGIYPEREYVDVGGLMAYGPNIPDTFRRSAGYVDRILRGAKPEDLPIEEPSKFDFIVNLRAARELGMSPSPDFLIGVGEVIE